MPSQAILQPILGTDKKNPVFTLYHDTVNNKIHVYYGFELLEIVQCVSNDFEYRLLAGRLYNAGIKVKSLQEAFKMDRKTIKRIGDALKSGNPEFLLFTLEGREAQRKLKKEIIRYIKIRFPVLYSRTKYGYSKILLAEINEIFGTKLTSETIRPLLTKLKKKAESREKGESICDCSSGEELSVAKENKSVENVGFKDENGKKKSNEINNRKSAPAFLKFPGNMVMMVNHLGVLLFSALLLTIEREFRNIGWILKQWFSCILLEAVNIEQTKLLDYRSLNLLLGQTIQTLHSQRVILTEISTEENVGKILRLNAELVEIGNYQDFYYDPHVKNYTGMQNILKGWCGYRHMADKILNIDFIHTKEGHPVYLEHFDNYKDLRERFIATIERFRNSIGIEMRKEITMIVDRGIYDIKVFDEVISDKYLHIVTWMKDYKAKPIEGKNIKTCIMEKTRNNSTDKKIYYFEYQVEDWERDKRMRLLHVHATNPNKKAIQVGILFDDKTRDVKDIIQLMFSRWLQENDFKYLGNHFGINEITSYAVIPYKRIKNNMVDKTIKNKEYNALIRTRTILKQKLGKYLVQQRNKEKTDDALKERISKIDEHITAIVKKIKSTKKEISKLEYLIEKDYVKLNTNNKRFMDSIKILARNSFYNSMDYFKRLYDNYRDDHVIFRNLLKSSGLILEQGKKIKVYLVPTVNYSPKIREIIKKTLEQINNTNPIFPDGSGRIFRLFLPEKAGIKLAIV